MKFTHLLALFVLLKDSIQLFGRDEDGYGNYDYQLTSYDSNGKPHPGLLMAVVKCRKMAI
jgi:hypothetical protein